MDIKNGSRQITRFPLALFIIGGISSIKRLQGLYQGTLVAQGAYNLYKKEVGGWPDAMGEDIVLT